MPNTDPTTIEQPVPAPNAADSDDAQPAAHPGGFARQASDVLTHAVEPLADASEDNPGEIARRALRHISFAYAALHFEPYDAGQVAGDLELAARYLQDLLIEPVPTISAESACIDLARSIVSAVIDHIGLRGARYEIARAILGAYQEILYAVNAADDRRAGRLREASTRIAQAVKALDLREERSV